MKLILILFIFLITSCSSNKIIFICGDHECIDKKEAKEYFENNLSIEVKTFDKPDHYLDLVELNNNEFNKKAKNNENLNEKKVMKIKNDQLKNQIKKERKLAKIRNKNKIKEEKRLAKIKKKEEKRMSKINKKKYNKKNKYKNKKLNESTIVKKSEICSIISKCDIDEISKFLLKKGNEKRYPDLSRDY
tara:strand:+ start:948 stop:1514 length:567 start_codon:yes stop_codon:yes gene_type:complete